MRERLRRIVLLAAFAALPAWNYARAAQAGADPAQAAGETTLWFNQGTLAPLGLEIARSEGERGGGEHAVADYRELRFALQPDSVLRWRADAKGRFAALEPGSAGHAGGFVLRLRSGGEVDLRGFRLRHSGTARIGLELTDAGGQAWFALDHAHHFVGDGGVLALRHMDLRLAPALARRLGRPELAGHLVGGAQTEGAATAAAFVRRKAAADPAGVCVAQWPSDQHKVDVRMLRLASNWEERQPDGVNSYRCGRSDGAGGHSRSCTADSSDGLVVLAPDASLRNDGTAAVAWHPKFSVPSAPYGNDQHPYLVWNLYRLDADGTLQQIGVSALKHAFHTINAVCGCEEGEVLYPGCEDTYGGFSNDFPSGLAPRSEVIPYSARWGRCGSLYDKDCDGLRDADQGLLPDDAYNPAKRLGVRESEIAPALHPGARWFLEYWYVVRDEDQPWNNLGLMEILPAKVRGQGTDPNAYIWRFEVSDFHNGSMLARWQALAPAGAWQRQAVVRTPLGRAVLATRVQRRADGRYRYQYQLFNFDLSLARSSGQEPNLRVLENRGLEHFAVWADPAATLQDTDFAAVAGSGVAWSAARADGRLAWRRGNAAALDWGRTFRFGFISDRPPQDSAALLGVGDQQWSAATLAPVAPPPPPRPRRPDPPLPR